MIIWIFELVLYCIPDNYSSYSGCGYGESGANRYVMTPSGLSCLTFTLQWSSNSPMSVPERILFFLAPLFDLVYIAFENRSKRILTAPDILVYCSETALISLVY